MDQFANTKACDPKNSLALLVDVQEKLFPKIYKHDELLQKLLILLFGLRALDIPIACTEQYPKGLGGTLSPLKKYAQQIFQKTTFSCMGDEILAKELKKASPKTCIVFGIETHICVLQTVRDLRAKKIDVVVCRDATSSRAEVDRDSGLYELGNLGARITTVETILFEMLQSKEHPQFKAISQCVK